MPFLGEGRPKEQIFLKCVWAALQQLETEGGADEMP